MNQELRANGQAILFDRDATIDLYRQIITASGADQCGCSGCKNFASQRGKIFPSEFRQFLNSPGVDPEKEWEAFDYDFDIASPSKPSLYGGWFLFIGELVEGLEVKGELRAGFTYWFTSSFPNITVPKDVKVCAVEFLIEIPWILPSAE
jgi:hypothetical protein